MIENKIKLCIETLSSNYKTVVDYKVKYLKKFGFASAYFKAKKAGNTTWYPIILVPDEDKDLEDFMVFREFLKSVGLLEHFEHNDKLDLDSLVSIFWFAEYERFKMSGKKSLHLDLADYGYEKTIRGIIKEYILPFESNNNVRCIFNQETKGLVVISDDDNEYFDEAREYLGV